MQTLSFRRLVHELEAAGAAPDVIARMSQELKDHCEDAETQALSQGMDPDAARAHARESLGNEAAIVSAVRARSELLSWRQRWPQSARCVDSLAYCLVLPAAPFVYCASHPAWIVRWSLSSSLATCVTASLLFAIQWLMAIGTPV